MPERNFVLTPEAEADALAIWERIADDDSDKAADRAAIGALAQKCLDAQGIGCAAWEQEIDERVAALYGL
ncbi:MAG TPA: hypothetical protein VIL86_08600 [Tepidisphaeraceae bacterium]|jgi:plasmid stabilization system protein ParE